MGVHNRRCNLCERRYAVLVSGDYVGGLDSADDSPNCPDCGSDLFTTLVGGAAPTGILPSKPLVLPSLGKTFETNGQYRAYCDQQLAENPHLRIVEGDDPYWRDYKDRMREKTEARARKEGFRDLEDKQREVKKANG